MKPSKATLQAFLDWVVAEQQGPTGWAVTDPAQELLRFAKQHNITLDDTNYERYANNRQTIVNRLPSAKMRSLRGTLKSSGAATGQLEAQEWPNTNEYL